MDSEDSDLPAHLHNPVRAELLCPVTELVYNVE